MSLTIVPFDPMLHTEETVRVLAKVRAFTPDFPPPADADSTEQSLREWLLNERAVARWVALWDGQVVGHVLVTRAHDYLLRHLGARAGSGLLEVGKLFVAPVSRGRGAGAALLTEAMSFAVSCGSPLALAVLPTSGAAIGLYERMGLEPAGSFDGVHGLNYVYVAR